MKTINVLWKESLNRNEDNSNNIKRRTKTSHIYTIEYKK